MCILLLLVRVFWLLYCFYLVVCKLGKGRGIVVLVACFVFLFTFAFISY